MIHYALIKEEDIVLEIGAGLGFLTRFLAQKSMRVIAVEIEHSLIKILREMICDLSNVNLIEGDILDVLVPQFNKVVSTPPYYISSSLLLWLLNRKFDCAVLIFQKEFAEKLVASVGSQNYGRLAVLTHYLAKVDLLDNVSRNMFFPPTKVESIVVRLKPRQPPFSAENRETFFELVNMLFTQRNRKIKNAIMPFLLKRGMIKKNAKMLVESLTLHDERVRELAPKDFGLLTNELLLRDV